MTDDDLPPVLVAVDGSPDATAAVTWAAHEAARRQTMLRIVHASPWTLLTDQPDHARGSWDQDALSDWTRGVVDDAVQHARDVEPGLDVDGELVHGDGPGHVLAICEGAGLVVVGRHGLGTTGSARAVGHAAHLLAAHGRRPVVVCGPDALPSQLGGREGPFLVGVDNPVVADIDLGEHRVLETAFDLARRSSGRLTVLHCWSDVDWGADHPVAGYLADWETEAKEVRVALADLVGYWHDRSPDVSLQLRVEDSRPAHHLVEGSASASAVVVGTRGRGGLPGLGVGAVAGRLIAEAHCPVVVVPAPARR